MLTETEWYIDWIQQHYPAPAHERDTVRVHILRVDGEGDLKARDLILSNATLVKRAVNEGKTTWDEHTVAKECAAKLDRRVIVLDEVEKATGETGSE